MSVDQCNDNDSVAGEAVAFNCDAPLEIDKLSLITFFDNIEFLTKIENKISNWHAQRVFVVGKIAGRWGF